MGERPYREGSPSFSVFCGESSSLGCPYRGLAAVSVPDERAEAVTSQLARVLAESGVAEFRWDELASARYRSAALRMLDCIILAVVDADLRADVLIWDTDGKLDVTPRERDADFEGMLFHLLKTTFKRRTPSSEWTLYADEKLGIEAHTLDDCILTVPGRPSDAPEVLFAQFIEAQKHVLRGVVPVRSHEHPLAQAATLLSELGVFSRHRYGAFAAWASSANGREAFSMNRQHAASADDPQRFELIDAFKAKASTAKLGVSLTSTRGLRTLSSSRPLNFWWYEPPT